MATAKKSKERGWSTTTRGSASDASSRESAQQAKVPGKKLFSPTGVVTGKGIPTGREVLGHHRGKR